MSSEEFKVSSDRKGRYYYRENEPDKQYRSVTTVLRWGEPKSKPNDGSKIGVIIHYMILRNLTDEFIEVPMECPYWISNDEANERIESALEMFRQLELEDAIEKWIFIEKAVWFEGMIDGVNTFYAGRIDAIAKFTDGKTRLVDIKTGDEYNDYPLQMAGYTQAIEHSLNIHIDECYICYLDVGSNWIKEIGKSFPRNPHRVPRIVVYNREELEIYMKLFNEKLVEVIKECE